MTGSGTMSGVERKHGTKRHANMRILCLVFTSLVRRTPGGVNHRRRLPAVAALSTLFATLLPIFCLCTAGLWGHGPGMLGSDAFCPGRGRHVAAAGRTHG